MTNLEYFAVVLFAVAFPLAGYASHKHLFQRLAAGDGSLRIKVYLNNSAILWGLLILVVFAWSNAGRDFAEMGFQLPATLKFWGGVAFAAMAILLLVFQANAARRSDDYRHQIIEETGQLVHLMPRSGRELGYFSGLAITAGIVEEVLYRGALIAYLSLWMETIWAAALALILFTLAHAYQGPKNALRAGVAGLALTVVYLLSGSIYPAIVLHGAIDLLGGAMCYYALSRGTGLQGDAEAPAES